MASHTGRADRIRRCVKGRNVLDTIKESGIRIVAALLPPIVALLCDHDLSSQAHIPVIGIAGVCVALCDALFGQIISNTRWIPFSACHKPCEAQELVDTFRNYHKDMFRSWIIAKLSSATAVTISAVMLLKHCPKLLQDYRCIVFAIGYAFLGIAMVTATEFILSYFSAMEESDRVKLKEMNYMFKKANPELFNQDSEAIDSQLEGFAAGYTSTPTLARQV